MELMLKPGLSAFRRTVEGVCYVFEPGLVVDVPDAHAETLLENGEVPRVIWPARTDAKGRAKHDFETLALLYGNAGDEEDDDEPDGEASPNPEGSDPPPKKPPAKKRTRKSAKKPESTEEPAGDSDGEADASA